jgi:hypothetical protein
MTAACRRRGLHANGDSFELCGGLHLPPVGTSRFNARFRCAPPLVDLRCAPACKAILALHVAGLFSVQGH